MKVLSENRLFSCFVFLACLGYVLSINDHGLHYAGPMIGDFIFFKTDFLGPISDAKKSLLTLKDFSCGLLIILALSFIFRPHPLTALYIGLWFFSEAVSETLLKGQNIYNPAILKSALIIGLPAILTARKNNRLSHTQIALQTLLLSLCLSGYLIQSVLQGHLANDQLRVFLSTLFSLTISDSLAGSLLQVGLGLATLISVVNIGLQNSSLFLVQALTGAFVLGMSLLSTDFYTLPDLLFRSLILVCPLALAVSVKQRKSHPKLSTRLDF